jgi:RNA polymerase II subunit A small phosphatase-like protein
MDDLDVHRTCCDRLFREHCTFYNGIFVKDLSRLNRALKDTIIIDNSPTAYLFHPECSLPITSWYDDMNDNELDMLTPILEALSRAEDVR